MWVARNKDSNGDGGRLFLFFIEKPTRHIYYDTWTVLGGNYDNMGGFPIEYGIEIDGSLFPLLTWKDEPLEVELTCMDLFNRFIDDVVHMYITSCSDDTFSCDNERIAYIQRKMNGKKEI